MDPRTGVKPKENPKPRWCPGGGRGFGGVHMPRRYRKRHNVRCPVCDRQIRMHFRRIPPHKATGNPRTLALQRIKATKPRSYMLNLIRNKKRG
jgi:hypothetical protein